MLGERMTNHDEDEVEDELEALEAEIRGVPISLPDAPVTELPAKERAKARQRGREEQQEAMLA